MKQKVKILILLIIGALLVSSCRTPEKLVRIALKRDPDVILCKKDTLKVIQEKEVFTSKGFDSIVVDNKRIYIKVLSEGAIDLEYILKEQEILVEETTPEINRKPTRQEVRKNTKIKTKEISARKSENKQENKTKRNQSDNNSKDIKNKNKKPWYDRFWIGFITPIAIYTIFKLIKKDIQWIRKFLQKVN